MTAVGPQAARRPSAGFSLIEVLVAMGLTLAVTAIIFTFSRAQMRAMHDQVRQVDLQVTARSVVDLFTREVRRAGMDPACVKTFAAIDSATQQEIKVLADLNGSGAIDQTNENVIYRINLTNQSMERLANGASSSLLDGTQLTGSRLRYFDGAGVERVPNPALSSADRNAIRRVRLELKLTKPAQNGGRALTAAAASDVDLRNRFFIANTGCS